MSGGTEHKRHSKLNILLDRVTYTDNDSDGKVFWQRRKELL